MAKRRKSSAGPWIVCIGAGALITFSGVGHTNDASASNTVSSKPSSDSLAPVVRAAEAAGFKGEDLVDAVAVAGAESDWSTSARNGNTDGSIDYGEWQVNSKNRSAFKLGDWRDLSTNARMAHKVWTEQGWGAWSTVNNGRYLRYLGRARLAVADAG